MVNPAVVVGLLAIMAVTVAGQGVAAYNVFVLAAVARLADIVLTDGTTRTSVNATFQMVPVAGSPRRAGFCRRCGSSGRHRCDGRCICSSLTWVGLGSGGRDRLRRLLVSVVWTVSGAGMYRSYRRALADEMRREPVAGD